MSEARRPSVIATCVAAMRPYQWTKNLLLFAALVFAGELGHPSQALVSLAAFAAFCLAASATYIFNDLLDIESDREHPKKRHRPLASGAMTPAAAWVLLVSLFGVAIAIAWAIRLEFLAALLAYVVLTLAYTLKLKHLMIIDVLAIALGFVVRAVAGALALNVPFSNWLVVCTLFLATFLGLSKRRQEILLLEEGAQSHRQVLQHYTVNYLDQLILIMASGTLITYTIYTCSPEVIQRLGTDKLYVTLPFVVYGLFRYLHLIHHETGGGDPSSTLIKDRPLGATVVLWALACALLIYLPRLHG
jgi:4-hydroxybenzoate polyprenyltransferase